MTQNCTWGLGFLSEDMGRVEYSYNAIDLWYTLTRSASTCKGPVYSLNTSFWIFTLFDRNMRYLKKKTKDVKINIEWTWFPNLYAQNGNQK